MSGLDARGLEDLANILTIVGDYKAADGLYRRAHSIFLPNSGRATEPNGSGSGRCAGERRERSVEPAGRDSSGLEAISARFEPNKGQCFEMSTSRFPRYNQIITETGTRISGFRLDPICGHYGIYGLMELWALEPDDLIAPLVM